MWYIETTGDKHVVYEDVPSVGTRKVARFTDRSEAEAVVEAHNKKCAPAVAAVRVNDGLSVSVGDKIRLTNTTVDNREYTVEGKVYKKGTSLFVGPVRVATRGVFAPRFKDVEVLVPAPHKNGDVWTTPNGKKWTMHEDVVYELVLSNDRLVTAAEHEIHARALNRASALMRSCKDSDHWNLRDLQIADTSYSPDVWLTVLANKVKKGEFRL